MAKTTTWVKAWPSLDASHKMEELSRGSRKASKEMPTVTAVRNMAEMKNKTMALVRY